MSGLGKQHRVWNPLVSVKPELSSRVCQPPGQGGLPGLPLPLPLTSPVSRHQCDRVTAFGLQRDILGRVALMIPWRLGRLASPQSATGSAAVPGPQDLLGVDRI